MKIDMIITTIFWSFIPGALTSVFQTMLYKITGSPTPAKQRMHQAVIFSCMIFSYFAFTVIQAQNSIGPNFYSVLNVPIDFKTKDLKVNYRSLSLKYHPDKNGHLSEIQKDLYHEKYISIRKAYEVLSNKNTKFAYEKLSDGILDCNNCKTKQDFMMHGLLNFVAYHGVSCIMIFVMDFFYSNDQKYWRYFVLLFQIGMELWLLVSNGDPLNGFFYPFFTTGERIMMLRSMGLSGLMAISSITSIWNVKQKPISSSMAELYHLNTAISVETQKWYTWIYEPFNTPSKSRELQKRIKDMAFIKRLENYSDLKKSK